MTHVPEPLLIVGAGGFAREAAAAVDATRAAAPDAPPWRLLGFLDDDPSRHGTDVDGRPVLGPPEALADHRDARVVLCTGNPSDYGSRRRLARRLALEDERYATLVHPTASVGSGSRIGRGTVLLAGVVTTASVAIGDHVAVMPGVVLTHDDDVADHVTFGAGALVAGATRIDVGAYIGAGARIGSGLTVGAWSLVGMGAVVIADVPPGEVWAGVPARRLRDAPTPDRPERPT